MFENTGVIDKKFYDKYTYALYSGVFKTCLLMWLCFVVISFLIGLNFYTALFISFVELFIFSIAFFLSVENAKKTEFKRITESTGKSNYVHTSYFENDCVVVKNHSTGAIIKLKYSKFVKLKKYRSVYLLFTKSKQFVPVFVENFSDKEKNELLSFLKIRLLNVKRL